MFDLTGKKALITGASGGIGKAIAQTFCNAGAQVIVSGTREAVLRELVNELGDRADYLTANLSDRASVVQLFTEAHEKLAGIDILVCNAGITKDNLAMRMKDEEWDEVINVNLTSSFILNREAIKKMIKARFGRIINISSVVGVTGNFGQANYVASKAGLIGMTKSIALETAARGVTVNCIAPGFIETNMTQMLKDEIKQSIIQKIPTQKMGTPQDIANAALFLASEEANYITGTTLHVNGGMCMV